MKDGTQQGIREVRRNDRERKKARERRNTPSFVASCSLSFFPRATNCCLSQLGKAEIERECYGEKKKGGGGLIGHARQYILPSGSTLHAQLHAPPQPHHHHHTHLFSTPLYQEQMDLTVFPCIPATQPPPLLPTTFLLPFSPWLRSFMTPHGFCHSVVSGKEREIPSRVSISTFKE